MQLQIASAVFMFEKWLSGDARDLVMGGEKKNALWQRELLTLHESNTVRRTVHLQVGKVTKVIVGG